MKFSKILSAAALAILAATGAAHAEVYDGVHSIVSANSRAQVNAEAVVAARSPNPYAEAYAIVPAPLFASGYLDRSVVRAQAVAVAHAPNQNVRRESFAGSVIPSQFNNPRLVETRQAGL